MNMTDPRERVRTAGEKAIVLAEALPYIREFSGKTVVLTTHYIEEAERISDEICIMQAGQIVARDTAAALVTAHGGAATIAFSARGFVADTTLWPLGRWTQVGERWSLAVAGEPGAALGAIVACANARGIAIDELDLRRPGLEDAFIAITGETLGDEATTAGVAA